VVSRAHVPSAMSHHSQCRSGRRITHGSRCGRSAQRRSAPLLSSMGARHPTGTRSRRRSALLPATSTLPLLRTDTEACRVFTFASTTRVRLHSRIHLTDVANDASNQPMKPTAPPRNEFSVLATTPCRGLSLSR